MVFFGGGGAHCCHDILMPVYHVVLCPWRFSFGFRSKNNHIRRRSTAQNICFIPFHNCIIVFGLLSI